jgi:hypothetical protein
MPPDFSGGIFIEITNNSKCGLESNFKTKHDMIK